MQLQYETPSHMVELAMPEGGYTVQHLIPHSSYAHDMAAAMLVSCWLTAAVMLCGFAMFLYVIRERENETY